MPLLIIIITTEQYIACICCPCHRKRNSNLHNQNKHYLRHPGRYDHMGCSLPCTICPHDFGSASCQSPCPYLKVSLQQLLSISFLDSCSISLSERHHHSKFVLQSKVLYIYFISVLSISS